MATKTLIARPGEIREYQFDYSQFPELTAQLPDTLTGSPAVATSPAGLTLSAPSISGSQVLVTITVGASLQLYSLLCLCNTAGGSRLGVEGLAASD